MIGARFDSENRIVVKASGSPSGRPPIALMRPIRYGVEVEYRTHQQEGGALGASATIRPRLNAVHSGHRLQPGAERNTDTIDFRLHRWIRKSNYFPMPAVSAPALGKLFFKPQMEHFEDYITGRFG